MNTVRPEQVVACLENLPALPTIVCDLLTSFADEDMDIGQLSRQITWDQTLTARLLRVANSSFYGLPSRVTTVNEAVVLLGLRGVRSLVLAVSMSRIFQPGHCAGFDPQAYNRHSVGTALAARGLAQLTGRNPELAFTAGILHNIGELVLASCFAEQYAAVLAYRELHDCSLIIAERDILGLDHTVVGGLLADTWRFPLSLRSAMAEHHAPAGARADSLADITHLADAIACGLGLAQMAGAMVLPVDQTAWQRLGLDGQKLARILLPIVDGMDEACTAFTG